MLPKSFREAQTIRDTLTLDPELSTSHNFKLDILNNRVAGFVDEAEAVAQAVYMMIKTERGKYSIYPDDYGLKKEDLYGQPRKYVEAALSYRIPECLLQDLRIKSVNNIEFEFIADQCLIYVELTCIFGEVSVGVQVDSPTPEY